jgi:hypothetical protein
MNQNTASTTQSAFQASPDRRDHSIKKHSHLGKYFPRLWLGVNKGLEHYCCKLSRQPLIKIKNQGGQA